MGVLTKLEPASVFHYFEEICSIPHTSHHEKALSDYCVQFAKAHGLACRQDEMGNVLIQNAGHADYENQPALILQGHLDMVDKTVACPLDLEKDAIQLVVDGEYVRAEGTTLGGDDGIAVAYALAVLDAKDIPPCAGGRADRLRGGGPAGCICHGAFRSGRPPAHQHRLGGRGGADRRLCRRTPR